MITLLLLTKFKFKTCWVSFQVLKSTRRLRSLQSQYSVHLSASSLHRPQSCSLEVIMPLLLSPVLSHCPFPAVIMLVLIEAAVNNTCNALPVVKQASTTSFRGCHYSQFGFQSCSGCRVLLSWALLPIMTPLVIWGYDQGANYANSCSNYTAQDYQPAADNVVTAVSGYWWLTWLTCLSVYFWRNLQIVTMISNLHLKTMMITYSGNAAWFIYSYVLWKDKRAWVKMENQFYHICFPLNSLK